MNAYPVHSPETVILAAFIKTPEKGRKRAHQSSFNCFTVNFV